MDVAFGEMCKNSHDEAKCREYYHTIVKKLQKESPVRPVSQKMQVGICEAQQYVLALSKKMDVVKAVFVLVTSICGIQKSLLVEFC